MNATKQAIWLFVALASLACSGWYFASSTPLNTLDEHTLSTTADVTVHDLTIHQYDSNGQLSHYLHTPLMRHIPENNTHWFKTPHIIIAQQNQAPWEIHAQQATAINGGQQISFDKHVVVRQKKDGHSEESTFKTEQITYYPKDKLAMTLLDVIYEQPGTTVRSTGMKAYLADKRIQLLSQARGSYVPKQG